MLRFAFSRVVATAVDKHALAIHCPAPLSAGWFKERSEVARSTHLLSSLLDKYKFDSEPIYKRILETEQLVNKWLRSPQAGQLVNWVDQNDDFLKELYQWAQRVETRLPELNRPATSIQASSIGKARGRAAVKAVGRYEELRNAYRTALEMRSWKIDLPRRALTSGLALSTSFLLDPSFFGSSGRIEAGYDRDRRTLYDKVFENWSELASSLKSFGDSNWDLHFGARSWQRAVHLFDLLNETLKTIQERLQDPTLDNTFANYLKIEAAYFGKIRAETDSVLILINRILQDLQSPNPRLKAAYEDEWDRALDAAQLFMNAIKEVHGKSLVRHEDLRQEPSMLEVPQPNATQRNYLERISSITNAFAFDLSIEEIVGEAERRLRRLRYPFQKSLAVWSLCRQISALAAKAQLRIHMAENLGLYDGHGSDPTHPDSMRISKAEDKVHLVIRELKQQDCVSGSELLN